MSENNRLRYSKKFKNCFSTSRRMKCYCCLSYRNTTSPRSIIFSTYPLVRDPTSKVERKVSSLIKFFSIPWYIGNSLIVQDSNLPRLYCLPKIHKSDAPLRSIVKMIDSPTFNVAKYLAKLLGKYTTKLLSHLWNSFRFVTLISN